MAKYLIGLTIVVGIGLLGFIQLNVNTNKDKESPNIVFIISDDHAAQAISAYGGMLSEHFPDLTPNIDKLADEGIRFENAFCTNSICGPSRASILTGKFSHINGFYKNESGGDFDGSQVTYPKLLQDAGYQTAVVGKWHLGSAPTGFDYSKVMVNWGGQGTYFNTVFMENGQDTVKESNYHSTRQVWEDARNWLENIRQKDKPFMLMYQFKAPHRHWEPDPQFHHYFENLEMPIPETFNDTYEGREAAKDSWQSIERNLNRMDLKVEAPEGLTAKEKRYWYTEGNNNESIWTPDPKLEGQTLKEWKYQKYIKDYLRCVKGVDHYVGTMMEYLEEQGLANNTIVVYTSDQGFYLGEHGMFDKRFMYEESLRMPLIVRYPEKIKPQSVTDELVMNVDFAPTLLDLVGVEVPADMQGKSFLNILDGTEKGTFRDAVYYHYYEFPWWHHVQPHYGIRTDRYKLIHFYYNPEKAKGVIQDTWELFDLTEDPNELNNLYGTPGYEEISVELKSKLQKIQEDYLEDDYEEMMQKTDIRKRRVYKEGKIN